MNREPSVNAAAAACPCGPLQAGAVSEEKTPWPRLALAGVSAALSEAFHLMIEWNAGPFGLPFKPGKSTAAP